MYEKYTGGMPFNVPVPAPAAGAQFTYLLPANYIYVPVNINYLLVTDATVGVRSHYLTFVDTDLWVSFACNVTQAASLTRRMDFSPNIGTAGFSVGSLIEGTIPHPVQLMGGTGSIVSLIGALAGGDQISGITIQFKIWPVTPTW